MSYIVEGYKFGLLNWNKIKKNMKDTYLYDNLPPASLNNNIPEKEKIRTENDVVNKDYIIPFDCADGLTIEELSDYDELKIYQANKQYIVFVMYDSLLNARSTVYYASNEREHAIIRYAYVIDIDKYKDNTIGEVVENHLISNIDNLSIQNKRRALCFLEEYIDNSANYVDVSIREYYRRKSNEMFKAIEFPRRLIYKNEDDK